MQPYANEIGYLISYALGVITALVMVAIGYKAGRDREGKPMLSIPITEGKKPPFHFTNDDEFSDALRGDDKKAISTIADRQ